LRLSTGFEVMLVEVRGCVLIVELRGCVLIVEIPVLDVDIEFVPLNGTLPSFLVPLERTAPIPADRVEPEVELKFDLMERIPLPLLTEFSVFPRELPPTTVV